jgi:hypothetical protein
MSAFSCIHKQLLLLIFVLLVGGEYGFRKEMVPEIFFMMDGRSLAGMSRKMNLHYRIYLTAHVVKLRPVGGGQETGREGG